MNLWCAFFSEPGEFSFEQASYHANIITGEVTCDIIRRKGCDGLVSLTYNTMWVNTQTIKSEIMVCLLTASTEDKENKENQSNNNNKYPKQVQAFCLVHV